MRASGGWQLCLAAMSDAAHHPPLVRRCCMATPRLHPPLLASRKEILVPFVRRVLQLLCTSRSMRDLCTPRHLRVLHTSGLQQCSLSQSAGWHAPPPLLHSCLPSPMAFCLSLLCVAGDGSRGLGVPRGAGAGHDGCVGLASVEEDACGQAEPHIQGVNRGVEVQGS